MKVYLLRDNLQEILNNFLSSLHDHALISEVDQELSVYTQVELHRSIERITALNYKWEIFFVGRTSSQHTIVKIDNLFVKDYSDDFKPLAYVIRRQFASKLVNNPELINECERICLQRSLVHNPVESQGKKTIAFVNTIISSDMKLFEPYEIVKPNMNPDILISTAPDTSSYMFNCKRKVLFNGEVSRYFDPSAYDFVFDTVRRIDKATTWIPLLLWEHGIEGAAEKRQLNMNKPKSRFCSFVVANGFPQMRLDVFNALNEYKKVDSGGPIYNNIGRTIPGDHKDVALIDFYAESKFVLCFENDNINGYVTEKLLNAFISGAIPIYWGCQEAKLFFNEKAFIHAGDFPSIDALIEKIKEIDQNDELYQAILNEPIFPFPEIPADMSLTKLRQAFEYGVE